MSKHDDELSQLWNHRISNANVYYDEWSRRFKTDKLEEFYYGKQWESTDSGYEPVMINLFYSGLQVQLPSLLFSRPRFFVKPKPAKQDWNLESAAISATLKQDVVNHFFSDKDLAYNQEISLAILDSQFRYGIVEVGYSADWIQNPNIKKPVTDERTDEEKPKEKEPVELIPETERIYVKRIPANKFRVGGIDNQRINLCSWYGYWEWVFTEDLKQDSNLRNIDNLGVSSGSTPDQTSIDEHILKQGDVTKIWKIWDLRAKKFYILADGTYKILFDKSFRRPSLFTLKFNEQLNSWYPLPPTYNWLSPQIEYNESREALRIHRRRFVRKYITRSGAFPDGEWDKLMLGGDGTSAESQIAVSEAVQPLPQAPLGAENRDTLLLSKDEFNFVSGTSSEQRGVADRTTATQASIIDSRTRIRESSSQVKVAEFMTAIAREVLLIVKEKLSLPFWIKIAADKATEIGEVTQIEETWRQISSQEIDDEDFETEIEMSSLSPVINDLEKRSFLEFLALVTQYPQISMSPELVREAAYRVGYRNEKVIQVMQKMALTVQLGLLQQAETGLQQLIGQTDQESNQATQQIVANQTPPDQEEIRNQIGEQLLSQGVQ